MSGKYICENCGETVDSVIEVNISPAHDPEDPGVTKNLCEDCLVALLKAVAVIKEDG